MVNFGGERVTQGIRGIITAVARVIHIHLEDILGAVRVVQEAGQVFDEAEAALMDEERGAKAAGRVAEGAEDQAIAAR